MAPERTPVNIWCHQLSGTAGKLRPREGKGLAKSHTASPWNQVPWLQPRTRMTLSRVGNVKHFFKKRKKENNPHHMSPPLPPTVNPFPSWLPGCSPRHCSVLHPSFNGTPPFFLESCLNCYITSDQSIYGHYRFPQLPSCNCVTNVCQMENYALSRSEDTLRVSWLTFGSCVQVCKL